MKLNEARKILGVDENASEDEVRKVFRKKAVDLHPDRNKESGAEEKFKQINEAYEVLKSGKASTREEQQQDQSNIWTGGFNIQDLFNNMGATVRPQRKQIVAKDITLFQTLTFQEAVAGCHKDLTYTHNVRCTVCEGAGQKPIDNGCTICHGSGQERSTHGFQTMIRPCPKCRGKVNYEACSTCKSEGHLSVTSTLSINIPPGATDGAILNLGPRGNYAGDIMGQTQNSRLSLSITVTPQEGLEIEEPKEADLKVIHLLKLSLFEALTGCQKTVPTIDGPKEVSIPPLSKHKDEIKLPRLGIGRSAPQTIILQVDYPSTSIDKLISALN